MALGLLKVIMIDVSLISGFWPLVFGLPQSLLRPSNQQEDQSPKAKSQCVEVMSYIELHARSAFSFLEGASVPEELIAVALELNMPAMALLDRDGVYGAPRFHLSAKKNGIKAHIGAEISVQSPKSKVQSRSFQSPFW